MRRRKIEISSKKGETFKAKKRMISKMQTRGSEHEEVQHERRVVTPKDKGGVNTLEKFISNYYTIEYDKKGKKIPMSELRKYMDLAIQFKTLGIKEPMDVVNAISVYEDRVKKINGAITIEALVKIPHEVYELYEMSKKVDIKDLKDDTKKIEDVIEKELVKQYGKSDSKINKCYSAKLEQIRKMYKSKINDPSILDEDKIVLVAAQKNEIKNIKEERLIAIKNHNKELIAAEVQNAIYNLKMIKGLK